MAFTRSELITIANSLLRGAVNKLEQLSKLTKKAIERAEKEKIKDRTLFHRSALNLLSQDLTATQERRDRIKLQILLLCSATALRDSDLERISNLLIELAKSNSPPQLVKRIGSAQPEPPVEERRIRR